MNSLGLPQTDDVIKSVVVSLTTAIVLFILRAVGIDTFARVQLLLRSCLCLFWRLFGVKHLLIYTDCDDQQTSTRTIAAKLSERMNDNRYRIVVVENPEQFLRWPLTAGFVYAVILVTTDVSSLSVVAKRKEQIQEKIKKYVQAGGLVILGHDVIYRRVKNKVLQELAGCTLTSFHVGNQDNSVPYIRDDDKVQQRVTNNKVLLNILPQTIQLYDKEYVIGKWMADVKYLYVHSDLNDNLSCVSIT